MSAELVDLSHRPDFRMQRRPNPGTRWYHRRRPSWQLLKLVAAIGLLLGFVVGLLTGTGLSS